MAVAGHQLSPPPSLLPNTHKTNKVPSSGSSRSPPQHTQDKQGTNACPAVAVAGPFPPTHTHKVIFVIRMPPPQRLKQQLDAEWLTAVSHAATATAGHSYCQATLQVPLHLLGATCAQHIPIRGLRAGRCSKGR